jgi:tetratricopeptide (TPR) repeat protein
VLAPSIALAAIAAHAIRAQASEPAASAAVAAEDAAESVPRQKTAAAQLRYAAEQRFARRASKGGLRHAIAAYRAVRRYFPGERAIAAEGAFRAGEMLRALGETEAARAEFLAAEDIGCATPFRARARLEIGHLDRRAGRLASALDAFLAVTADCDAERRWRDEAALWTGRVYAELSRTDDARRWWRQVAESGGDDLARIRAFDAWAASYAETGDVEAAAGVLAACHRAFGSVAAEETERGSRVRRALESMGCLRRMRDEIAKR